MNPKHAFETLDCIYENPLSSAAAVEDWILEGKARIGAEHSRLLLQNELDPEVHGDEAHWVLWCPVPFPDEVMISWDFYPLEEPGLCMLFFAAQGEADKDLFDASLPARTGEYPQYHSGAINAFHLSYFRHKQPEERAFRTCNLRKSKGFHLAASGADPLPPAEDAVPPYHLKLIKYKEIVQFTINDLPVLEWEDDDSTYGALLKGGYLGFRQMAPMKAAYANLKVHRVAKR